MFDKDVRPEPTLLYNRVPGDQMTCEHLNVWILTSKSYSMGSLYYSIDTTIELNHHTKY